jgi:hypothetical protein
MLVPVFKKLGVDLLLALTSFSLTLSLSNGTGTDSTERYCAWARVSGCLVRVGKWDWGE